MGQREYYGNTSLICAVNMECVGIMISCFPYTNFIFFERRFPYTNFKSTSINKSLSFVKNKTKTRNINKCF